MQPLVVTGVARHLRPKVRYLAVELCLRLDGVLQQTVEVVNVELDLLSLNIVREIGALR